MLTQVWCSENRGICTDNRGCTVLFKLKMMFKNLYPIRTLTLGGLSTKKSRSFSGSYEKSLPQFFKESPTSKQNLKIRGFPGFPSCV